MQGSYLLFNRIIAAIFAAIIIYFLAFPLLGDYTLKCVVQQQTGHLCIGCGLTRGIHQALIFNFSKAQEWNGSSLLITFFFVFVLISRFIVNRLIKASTEKHTKTILYIDTAISILLFLFCFRHFFTNQLLK
ncbi:MAG TPA: DUF2752 domain-containing protein [Bacteroidia bacterium]|jgi:hypothetical protein|nr:DUF2752 domain-containing protein [Bacteroidia bacterium]